MTSTNTSRAAAALGRKGGRAKSAAKAAAARANGAKGGRPAVGGLLQYIPARLRAHVVDAYRDSDGIWVHFGPAVRNPANESGTIHADSVRELREEARECVIVQCGKTTYQPITTRRTQP